MSLHDVVRSELSSKSSQPGTKQAKLTSVEWTISVGEVCLNATFHPDPAIPRTMQAQQCIHLPLQRSACFRWVPVVCFDTVVLCRIALQCYGYLLSRTQSWKITGYNSIVHQASKWYSMLSMPSALSRLRHWHSSTSQ